MKSWPTKIEALPGKILIISHLVPLIFLLMNEKMCLMNYCFPMTNLVK